MPAGLNEPCIVSGYQFSGLDTCAKGLFCWGVTDDTLEGFCQAQCQGTLEDPVCPPPVSSCQTPYGDLFSICALGCNPIWADCADPDSGCYPLGDIGAGFSCSTDESGPVSGQEFDPCAKHSDCDNGFACLPAAGVDECAGQMACCLPFCDVSSVDTVCPGGELECLPWFAEGTVSPFDAKIGVCKK